MLMFFASDVVVSKGYQNAPALKFSEKGDFVRFRRPEGLRPPCRGEPPLDQHYRQELRSGPH